MMRRKGIKHLITGKIEGRDRGRRRLTFVGLIRKNLQRTEMEIIWLVDNKKYSQTVTANASI